MRCVQVDFPSYKGVLLGQIVKTHLGKQDYGGAYCLMEENQRFFSGAAISAVHGAHCRSLNLVEEAKKHFQEAGVDLLSASPNQKIVEYYLAMKWRCDREEYSVFALMLTPLIAMLYEVVLAKKGFVLEETFKDGEERKKGVVDRDKVKKSHPYIYKEVLGGYIRDHWSSGALGKILNYYVKDDDGLVEIQVEFTWMLDKEEKLRHVVAHRGNAIVKSDLEDTILDHLEAFIKCVMEAQAAEFDAYERQRDCLMDLVGEEV